MTPRVLLLVGLLVLLPEGLASASTGGAAGASSQHAGAAGAGAAGAASAGEAGAAGKAGAAGEGTGLRDDLELNERTEEADSGCAQGRGGRGVAGLLLGLGLLLRGRRGR